MNPLEFILLDLFPNLQRRTVATAAVPDRSRPSTFGNVYTGGMSPMAWIQRQQEQHVPDISTLNSVQLRDLGNQAFQNGELQKAISYYSEAINIDPSNELNFSNRSLAFFKLQQYQASVEDAQTAVKLKPDFYKGYYRLAQAYMAMGLFVEAQAASQQALVLAPEAEKESLKILLAKIESKLVRNPNVTSPLRLERTPTSSSPTVDALVEARTDKLEDTAKAITSLLSKRNGIFLQRERDRVSHSVAYANCQRRESQIRKLLAQIDPELVVSTGQIFDAAQSELRKASLEANRELYQRALTQRNHALQSLVEVSEAAEKAIEQIQHCGETMVLSSEEVFSAFPPPASDASSSSPSSSSDSIESLMSRRKELRTEVEAKLQPHWTRSNNAITEFLTAAAQEEKVYDDMKSLLDEEIALSSKLRSSLTSNVSSNSLLTPQRLQTIQSLVPVVKRLVAEKDAFFRDERKGDDLLQLEAKLERERLYLEKRRIQLQAELEWLLVKEDEDSPHKILRLREAITAAQSQLKSVFEQQTAVQKQILDLMNGTHPELRWKAAAGGSKIVRWIKGSGLWVSHTFAEYQIISTIASTANSKVYHAVRRGEEIALKEIPMESEKVRRRFQNEINIISNASTHPNIIKLNGVFFDGNFAYIVMPFFKNGNLKSGFVSKAALPAWKIQELFRQIVSAIVYLHEKGIVHADIKPSNVLLTNDFVPQMADFGLARDVRFYGERDLTRTGVIIGTEDYMAPELLVSGTHPTTMSDVWSLGVTMLQVANQNAHAENEVVQIISLSSLSVTQTLIDAASVGGNERLAELLTKMLCIEAAKRVTAIDALAHPYFNVSLLNDMVQNRELINSNEKLEAFRSHVHTLRSVHRETVLVSVCRNQMVESLCEVFPLLDETAILKPFLVVFQGEQGIDEGALTSEMFHLFFVQSVVKHKLLVNTLDQQDPSNLAGEFLLNFDPRIPLSHFVVFGKILLKTIIENRPVPVRLNASVIKFILGTPPSQHDLEAIDGVLVTNFKRFTMMSADDLAAVDLDFSEFGKEALAQTPDITASTKVSPTNVQQYVKLKVEHELVGKRLEQLKALKEGFFVSNLLKPHLQLLSATELLMLLGGHTHLHSKMLIEAMEFEGYPSNSGTPAHLKQLLEAMSQHNLKRFLRLCTSMVSIPFQGLPRKIKVIKTGDNTRLPVGHACAFQLDLPDYDNLDLLKEKLAVALAHVDDGFFIV